MTDLEITKLCAEAMGYTVCGSQEPSTVFYPHPNVGSVICVYEPMNNDAQAMALLKKFKLSVDDANDGGWFVVGIGGAQGANQDLNRAICECVARMPTAPHNK